VIPASQLGPLRAKFLAARSRGRFSDGFYRYATNSKTDNDQYLAEWISTPVKKHRLTGRYFIEYTDVPGAD